MTIKTVSRRTGLSADTLRYYEKIGLIGKIRRKSGIRDYDENDIKVIEFIKCMRSVNMPIENLIEYVNLVSKGDETVGERKNMLIKQRENVILKMNEMQSVLERLDYKIKKYETLEAEIHGKPY